MYNKIVSEIGRVDCNLNGVSYDMKEKFLLPKGDNLYFIAAIADSYANKDVNYSYSVLDMKTMGVLSKDSKEYKEVVKDLPPCQFCKSFSGEPFKSWEFNKTFRKLVDDICKEGCLSDKKKEEYRNFVTHKRNLIGGVLYNHLLIALK